MSRVSSIYLALLSALCFAGPVLATKSPVTPRCWGVVTTGPQGGRVLVCQNPCIGGGPGGGNGCIKIGTENEHGEAELTCKCQGGSTECCDIWIMSDFAEEAHGTCEPVGCGGGGACTKQVDAGGDAFAECAN